MRLLTALSLMLVLAPLAALAQSARDEVFVQIEARPSLAEATNRARAYARDLPDVNGFALGSGWYAIALGPYRAEDAGRVLRVYRREGVIARDSYIAQSAAYGARFWPEGAQQAPSDPAPQVTAPAPQPALDETLREARASESRLDRDARAALQTALQWAGVYEGAIDAAFGRGTRAAMALWQRENGFEPTGVLTTRQRAELMAHYTAVLDDLGLETVRDTQAGIEIALPLGVVGFDRHEPPFAQYRATGDLPAQVLLISQPGDRTTLAALYDILQTLEIVPERGPRRLDADGFTITGADAWRVSQTGVTLRDGAIKGFTLVWPAGDEARRTRLYAEMERSLARLPGTLDAILAPQSAQRIDLLAGLALRRPARSRSGFFVDAHGAVVTTAEAVEGCGRITIDETHEAEIARVDAARGIAVLRPRDPLAPRRVARLHPEMPAVLSRVAVAGFSYEGRLGAPTVTFGHLTDLRGLDGETHLKRLALDARAGDEGGPVLDAGGAVLGMLLADATQERALPEGVRFAATTGALHEMLSQSGITPDVAPGMRDLSPEALTDEAAKMTVLVSCWD